jgi:diguanylate cyclase (GGDEF)-like protein
LSLDRFTVVHDTLGREAENGLLVAVAARLRHCLRNEATLARLGGDDFAILLEDVQDAADTVRVAKRITSVLDPSFTLGDQEVFLTTSIGIAMTSEEAQSADDLLHQANVALHRAVEQGGDCHQLFDEALSTAALRRMQLETDLRRGIDRGELVVYYQPVIELKSGRVVECEALVRWQHPTHGLIPPMDFIPLAEQTGLIIQAGTWVLGEACRQTKQWQDDLGVDLRVAVNLSARQFEDPDLLGAVTGALRDTALAAGDLVLEITETAVIRSPKTAATTIETLRSAGVRLAIDDFGTGYSSLSYLKSFPVHVLKIDQSFTQRLGEDSQDTAIVQAILALAQSLGLAVTAEGVETAEQLAWLHRSEACDLVAGYLFSRPLPADEVVLLLDRPFAGYAAS